MSSTTAVYRRKIFCAGLDFSNVSWFFFFNLVFDARWWWDFVENHWDASPLHLLDAKRFRTPLTSLGSEIGTDGDSIPTCLFHGFGIENRWWIRDPFSRSFYGDVSGDWWGSLPFLFSMGTRGIKCFKRHCSTNFSGRHCYQTRLIDYAFCTTKI